ncbi:MAG: hypothetical protein ACMUIU_05950 [bacterium]
MSIDIKKEDKYILARQTGEDSYAKSLELWRGIIKACNEYQCFNILGICETEPLSTIDAFKHEKIFRETGVSNKHRIAWVEKNQAAREKLKFAETVLKNRGFVNARLFTDVSEAKAWLLKE